MKISIVRRNIYLAKFKSLKEMGLTFVRFQEYYESPKFRGKIFTVKKYRKWYEKKYGDFSYCTDWEGFNVPGWVIRVFQHGTFNPLTKREQKLLKALGEVSDPFYLIGAMEKDQDTLDHEIAHALYYTEKRYRFEVQQLLKCEDLRPLKKWMLSIGYCKEVLDDECHAYLGVDPDSIKVKIPKQLVKQYEAVGEDLRELYKEWRTKI